MASANYRNRVYEGYVIGTPRYAPYEPHHTPYGYTNMYHPVIEVALRWFMQKRLITIDGVSLVRKKGEENWWVMTDRGGGIEFVVPVREDEILETDWIDDGEERWEYMYDATIGVEKKGYDNKVRMGKLLFRTKKDMNEFIREVKQERQYAEEKWGRDDE